MSTTIPVVWTNDDIHFGDAARLRRILDFLQRHGIPGVFFIIPQSGGDLDQDKELLKLIEQARARGHEFYQHGFRHTAFECGMPEAAMLKHDPVATRRLANEREAIEATHTLEAQIEMLDNGRRIWRRAFGEDSKGFRPGWGAFCDNFYRALKTLNYEWVSSQISSFTSWDWNLGLWDAPVRFRENVPTRPFFHPQGIREFPLGGDYAFTIPNDPVRLKAMVGLGLREFEVYAERRDPMMIVSHPQGLEFSGARQGHSPHAQGTGYAIHEELVPALLKTGRTSFVTLTELVSRYPVTPVS